MLKKLIYWIPLVGILSRVKDMESKELDEKDWDYLEMLGNYQGMFVGIIIAFLIVLLINEIQLLTI